MPVSVPLASAACVNDCEGWLPAMRVEIDHSSVGSRYRCVLDLLTQSKFELILLFVQSTTYPSMHQVSAPVRSTLYEVLHTPAFSFFLQDALPRPHHKSLLVKESLDSSSLMRLSPDFVLALSLSLTTARERTGHNA